MTDRPKTLPSPPVAPREAKIDIVHGERRVDDYFWLRDKGRPGVAAYLEAENAYADAVMRGTEDLQEKLYQEMLGHIKETDLSVPYLDRGWFYYHRTEEGKQYPIRCRRKGNVEAPEEVTLDLNELGRNLPFIALGAYTVNDGGGLLAYSLDVTGFRQYTLFVKDLRTGEVLPDRVERTGTIAWAADGRTLFYTVEDDAKRHYRLYRHRLGETEDALVYEEKDERFNIAVGRLRSRRFLVMEVASHTASEVWYLPIGDPGGTWRVVVPREPEHEYEIDHHGEHFYIRTNSGGRNFRLVRAPIVDPRRDRWEEIVPHRESVMLEGMDFFAKHYVLHEREGGLPRPRVTDLASGLSHRIEFPEPAYSVGPAENFEFESSVYRFAYQSLVTPPSVYAYDMDRRGKTLLKELEIPGYDPSLYESERIAAPAPDGAPVPISLVRRKDAPRDGSAPMLLTGYGSYGYPYPILFSSNRLSFLDRGMTVAIAHVRGGGELGKAWHDAGRMMNKRNTFVDFIAAAEHLIARKDTSRDRLIVEGGSAGGLLMGAIVNMRPELFRLVISKVPFVDVINTMLDESLPLTVGEFEEWGNPKVRVEHDYMRSYCPYSNLEAKGYPAMLIKTSFNDSQVMYWEPAKYTAKLRTLKTDDHVLVLKTNMAAGHGGASGRYDYLREIAFDFAFVLNQLDGLPR